jgi:hypothetical protein
MAVTGKQIAQVYFDVVANTGKAAADLEKLKNAAEKDLQASKDRLKANKEFIKLKEKSMGLTKKELASVAARIKADKNASRESISSLKEKVKAQQEVYKKQEKAHKKQLLLEQLMDSQVRRIWTNFTDWSGQKLTERTKIAAYEEKASLKNYQGFLRRASREESRFANKLDQRDMTKSTIENLKRGFSKGILISEKWHRDENQLQRISRGLGIAGGSMDRIKSYAERAADGFYKLQRVGFTLQAGLSVIGSTLGSLVGGFLGIIGVVAQAGAAVVGVASAFLSVAAGAIAAKIALGGVGKAVSALWDDQNGYNRSLRDAKRALRDLRFEAEQAALSEEEAALALERAREELARVQDLPPDSRARREVELQYQQAELAYRRTKARNKDAREDLKKGPLSGAAAQDPLKNLTESQKKFAKYLVTLKPKLMELREAAASGFLPLLQQGIENIVANAFPTFKKGLETLGAAMGEASKSFSSAIANPENLKLLTDFFNSSAPIIRIFGQAAGSAFGGILAVLKAAEPLTSRFATWVREVAIKFEEWAKSGATTTLRDFFNLSGDVAAKLGTVFRKVFDGISNVTKAAFPSGPNSGAGGLILKWLDKLSSTFKAFTSGPDFGTWLKGSTDNALTALDTLGQFANIFVKVGSAPETKQFWMTIQGAVPFLQKIVEDGLKAAPLLGEVVVQFVRMFAILSDSGTLDAFFTTLGNILKAFNGFLEVISPVLKVFGPLHGIILAVTLALSWFLTGGKVLFGVLEKITRTFGNMQAGIVKVAAESLTLKARYTALTTETSKLIASQAKTADGTVKLKDKMLALGIAFNKTQRAAGTAKRSAMLVEMARAAGATTKQVQKLRAELNLAAAAGASSMTQLTRASAMAQKLNLAGAGSGVTRGRGALARGGGAALGGAAVLGSMGGGTGPVSGLMGGAAMIASFLPGPLGLISGAVLGIGSAIAGGFEAQAEADKQKAEAEKQKKLEIQAKLVEMRAENVNEVKGATQTLIGAGALATDVQGIIDKGVSDLKAQGIKGITDYNVAFQGILDNGFADVFAGQNKTLKSSLLKSIGTVAKTGLYSPEEAARLLDPIFDQAGGGKAGLAAVDAFIKKKKFNDVTIITPESGSQAYIGTQAEATAQANKDATQKAYAPIIAELEKFSKMDWRDIGTEEFTKAFGKDSAEKIGAGSYRINKDGEKQFTFFATMAQDEAKARIAAYKEALKTGDTSLLPTTTPYGAVSNTNYSFLNKGKQDMATTNYTRGMMNAVIPKTPTAETNALTSTANSAASLANTTSNLASVIKSWSEKPTYTVLTVGTEVKEADVPSLLDKFVNTGGVSVRRAGG